MNIQEQKTEVLRARVEPSFKEEVVMIARLKRLDEADFVRIACAQLIERFKSSANMMNII